MYYANLCGVMLEGRNVIQRALDRRERCGCTNLMRFNFVKYKVLHLSQGNDLLKKSCVQKDLRILVDNGLVMSLS